jgi:putative FmdB family regulatory protein
VPLYEYQCPKCGTFELIRKFSDDPVTTCPTCGSPIEKLASAPAFHLKGTGWYVTDYAKKSGGADGKSSDGKSGGKSSESKSEGQSESKSGSGSGDSGKSASGTGAAETSSAAPAKPPSKKSD